jgi:hypothetical protein
VPRLHRAEGALLTSTSELESGAKINVAALMRIPGDAVIAELTMSQRNVSIMRSIGACVAIAIGLAAWPAQAWESAHGDRDNSGFANVTTAPAGKGSVSVPGLGTFAPGAGPVIAPDGTVYLGTTQGKLIALHADGKPFWSREITRGQSIVASPAIASDGSVYVIGVERIRDNRVKPPKETYTSTLHRFTSSGGWLAQIPFPEHQGRGPAALAPPNIWRSGGVEAIMVPVAYQSRHGRTTHLFALSLEGDILDETTVHGFAFGVLGGDNIDYIDLPPVSFTPPLPAHGLLKVPPAPGAGIFVSAAGGSSFLAVSDHHKDVVGYTFAGSKFKEVFRAHQEDFFMRTPPVILASGHTLMFQEGIRRDDLRAEEATRKGRLIATGPGAVNVSKIIESDVVQAPPTRLADGRVVLVTIRGGVIVLQGTQVVAQFSAHGSSSTSAAASNNHFFVSTANTFMTYQASSLAEVSRIDWVGGGLNPPAIGPKGHVYAIASNILFVFPPPIKKPKTVVNQPLGGLPVATNPGSGTPPQQQSYKPPITANGNRLFACEELDGDDCGKGDYQTISTAFCKKQGFVGAGDVDVDSKKVKAETLDGRFCSKNKCKVFEQIICANN